MKRYLTDINLWFLLGINIWSLLYYQAHPNDFNSVVWLYWGQSVLIGLFNFVDLLTIPAPPIDGKLPQYFFKSKGCSALFFLCHYQFFHLVYAVFLVSGKRLDMHFILSALAFYAFNLGIQFYQHKKAQSHEAPDIGKMFFLPYLRIIPMHLMILLPAFFHVTPSIVFLFLKTLADIIMYLITSPVYRVQTSPVTKEVR